MYSPEQRSVIYDRVCRGIACGLSLRKICDQDGMPDKNSVRLWLIDDADFYAQYARAREARADARSDRIDEIAEKVEDGELDANSARVIIDAEKWQAGKENSKRYGDKIQVDGEMTTKLSDDQLESRLAQFLGKAGIAGLIAGEGTPEGSA